MGIGQAKLLSDTEIVNEAHAVELKVYAGFQATERRLVFVHDDKFHTKQKLKTIQDTGDQHGDDQKISCKKDKALVTYPFEQILTDEQAQQWLHTPFVRQKNGRNVLVQVWPINYNDEFRKRFKVSTENEELQYFDEAAAENLKSVAVELFGEAAKGERIKYCKRETKNIQRVYVGTTGQFKAFFKTNGIKEALGIKSVNGNSVVVHMSNQQNKNGTRAFALSSDPNERQVLYKRRGWTSFMCLKSEDQFSKECELFGVLDTEDAVQTAEETEKTAKEANQTAKGEAFSDKAIAAIATASARVTDQTAKETEQRAME